MKTQMFGTVLLWGVELQGWHQRNPLSNTWQTGSKRIVASRVRVATQQCAVQTLLNSATAKTRTGQLACEAASQGSMLMTRTRSPGHVTSLVLVRPVSGDTQRCTASLLYDSRLTRLPSCGHKSAPMAALEFLDAISLTCLQLRDVAGLEMVRKVLCGRSTSKMHQ